MTIIRPHKLLSLHALFAAFVSVLLGASVLYGIWLYNGMVNLAHEVETQSKALERARVQNAELKNQLFGQLDSSRLETLARQRNLVPERQPQYFESDPKWLSASR